MLSGHAFDPTDVHVYEFLIQGTPNPAQAKRINYEKDKRTLTVTSGH